MRRASAGVSLLQARLRRTLDGRRRLSEAIDLLPAVLRQVANQSGRPEAEHWVLHAAHISGTQVIVLMVGPPGEAAAAVVKIPATAAGVGSQRREADALATLAKEASLGDLAELIPARIAEGEVAGRAFTAERAVPGVEGRVLLGYPSLKDSVVNAAAALITVFHLRTATATQVDAKILEAWVDRRLEGLATATRNQAAVGRLKTLLHRGWEGRTATVSWVHGDFWPANVIFDPDSLEVTGVIDWEWAAPGELPAHDLVYLLIQMRMLAEDRELGPVVQALLQGAPLEPPERAILEAGGVLAAGETALEPETILLVWLRHVAYNLIQSPDDARNWVWTSRNVDAILRLI